jgi:hypothetical protein
MQNQKTIKSNKTLYIKAPLRLKNPKNKRADFSAP